MGYQALGPAAQQVAEFPSLQAFSRCGTKGFSGGFGRAGLDFVILEVFSNLNNKLSCCVIGLGCLVLSQMPSIHVRSTKQQEKSTLLREKYK